MGSESISSENANVLRANNEAFCLNLRSITRPHEDQEFARPAFDPTGSTTMASRW